MMRRGFLAGLAGTIGLGTLAMRGHAAPKGQFPYTLSDAEWRDRLTNAEYRVMREHGTERAFTSPLNNENRAGTFVCKGCNQPVYPSEAKYDSGTGWPSFWKPVSADAIGTSVDRSLFMVRTECHCSNCGSHLGHIFNDGPQPTGKRHCINGVSLNFVAA